MIIIGHRGARGLWPENTIAGFERAISEGVRSFELDVAITADDIPVISHDPHLNPDITRLNGKYIESPTPLISSLTYSVLEYFDVGRINPESEYAKRFPEQQPIYENIGVPHLTGIPRLVDILHLAYEKGVHLTLEIKTFPEHPEWTCAPQKFVYLVARQIIETKTRFYCSISSFDFRVLRITQELLPGMTTDALTQGPIEIATIDSVDNSGAEGWSPEHNYLERWHVDYAQRLGLAVVPYTANDPADFLRLQNIGVDGIITDYPVRYLT